MEFKKDVKISFRTTYRTKLLLTKEAECNGTTVSNILNKILKQYYNTF